MGRMQLPEGEDGFVHIFLSFGKEKLRCCRRRDRRKARLHRTAEDNERTDSLRCGEATAGQTVHRTVCLDRPFESTVQRPIPNQKHQPFRLVFGLSMGYEKDIFAGFAYEFELSQFLVKYRLTPK